MRYIYNSEGILTVSVFEGTDKEIKAQYGENIYISDNYYGENAIIENGSARAKTRIEKIMDGEDVLLDGEYIENNEIVIVEKPSNFHYWNSETNEWIYDKELEINSLEEELGTLELNIFNKQNEIEVLKKAGKNFAAKKLEKEVAELEKLFEEKLARYEELEG